MKKIVALVLSLVMVLGLATTAFGAITLWAPNGSTEMCDIYDGEYNTKQVDNVAITFHPAVALKLDKTGTATNVANIPYYTIDGYNYTFVLVPSIPVDADAADYALVKAHSDKVDIGDAMVNQSATDAYYILKAVDYVYYTMTATAFTAWSDDCEAYADPELVDPATQLPVAFYTLNNKSAAITDLSVKYAETTANAGNSAYMALVGDEVVVVGAPTVAVTLHTWRASSWDAKGVATAYTCENCKTVGTVINASINAPTGAKIDKLPNGTLVAYTKGVTAPAAGDKVESAQTFDAGIAMYVGMSVMAAAGSAVVLKKKD